MKGNRRPSPIRMPVLAVRPPLPDLFEAKLFEKDGHFAGFQDRY